MNERTAKSHTRSRLLEAGMQTFLEHGYHGTGIKAILDQVGIPKGSFYNYFESKDAFGAATIAYYADEVAERMTRAFENAPDPVEGLRAFFCEEMDDFERNEFVGGCLVANLGGEIEHLGTVGDALATALARYIRGITGAVTEGQAAGLVRTDLPAEELANVLVDTWEGAVIRMKIENSLEPLRNCLKHLLDNYFRPS